LTKELARKWVLPSHGYGAIVTGLLTVVSVTKAVNSVIWRILVFYLGSIAVFSSTTSRGVPHVAHGPARTAGKPLASARRARAG
jgi:hypothetical protein